MRPTRVPDLDDNACVIVEPVAANMSWSLRRRLPNGCGRSARVAPCSSPTCDTVPRGLGGGQTARRHGRPEHLRKVIAALPSAPRGRSALRRAWPARPLYQAAPCREPHRHAAGRAPSSSRLRRLPPSCPAPGSCGAPGGAFAAADIPAVVPQSPPCASTYSTDGRSVRAAHRHGPFASFCPPMPTGLGAGPRGLRVLFPRWPLTRRTRPHRRPPTPLPGHRMIWSAGGLSAGSGRAVRRLFAGDHTLCGVPPEISDRLGWIPVGGEVWRAFDNIRERTESSSGHGITSSHGWCSSLFPGAALLRASTATLTPLSRHHPTGSIALSPAMPPGAHASCVVQVGRR